MDISVTNFFESSILLEKEVEWFRASYLGIDRSLRFYKDNALP